MNLDRPNRQRVKVADAQHPQLQLDGRFGLPVYQLLPIHNIAARTPRRPEIYGYVPVDRFRRVKFQ